MLWPCLLTHSSSVDRASRYFARSGDTLADIARETGLPESHLRTANPGVSNPDWLLEGQIIAIPFAPTSTKNTAQFAGHAPWEASIWANTPWYEKALVATGYGFEKKQRPFL